MEVDGYLRIAQTHRMRLKHASNTPACRIFSLELFTMNPH